uniref:Glomulin, FKBP associated protein b n=1 Tax=Nothobranchius furzeri TaxID=105023 RepID=A0A8C6L6R0_NOTFU
HNDSDRLSGAQTCNLPITGRVIVKSMGCGLLAPLVSEVVKNKESHDHCQAAITQLTKVVIENTDPGVISETILALLPHLQTVLLQLDERKAAGVGLVLSALQKQLSWLPVPYTQQQEEADQYGLCRCCRALTMLAQPFVEEVKKKDENLMSSDEDEEMKTELLKFCMRSLREPLLEADLNRGRKSALWLHAVEIMGILSATKESLSGLLFFTSWRRGTLIDNSLSKESRACLAYLLFVQLISMEGFPAVFSGWDTGGGGGYIFTVCSNGKPASTVNLRYVLINCPLQHLRKSGLQDFQLFINKLDAEAKHKFFRCMLKTSNHAGVEAYIVKNIKNEIQSSMKMFWFFPSRIMETLNLLRYLTIIFRFSTPQVEMWKELCRIKDQYLKIVRVCISMSRAYYCAELKSLKEDIQLKAKGRDCDQSDCCLDSQVLQSALVTFDMMESVVVRIEEITEEKLSKMH